MGRSKPSIREVAALAGVSTATVSNVFSGRKPVNDDRKTRVFDAAKQLGFQIDPVASQLRSGRGRIIAVLVPDLTDTFFATIVSHLETMASQEGYDVIVASSHDNPAIEASRLKALLSWRPAGLILTPCSAVLPSDLPEIAERIPTVLVDRIDASAAITDTVTIDNFEAGQIAANHLVHKGHRDIVIAVSNLSYAPIRDRAEGASTTIAARTGRMPRILKLGSNAAEGARVFSDWIAHNALPGAVFALTNVTTLSVLSALAEHRVLIPEGISVVAFDDYPWMAARNIGLTAIRQPADEFAATAWMRLRLRMVSETAVKIEPTVLRASLIVRDSVRDLTAVESLQSMKVASHTPPGGPQSPKGQETGLPRPRRMANKKNARGNHNE